MGKRPPEIDLGTYIRQCRAERKLTLAQVAAYTGLSVSYLSQLETGQRKQPSDASLVVLAELFEIDESYLAALSLREAEICSLPILTTAQATLAQWLYQVWDGLTPATVKKITSRHNFVSSVTS